jgi:hypothetical protein
VIVTRDQRKEDDEPEEERFEEVKGGGDGTHPIGNDSEVQANSIY